MIEYSEKFTIAETGCRLMELNNPYVYVTWTSKDSVSLEEEELQLDMSLNEADTDENDDLGLEESYRINEISAVLKYKRYDCK